MGEWWGGKGRTLYIDWYFLRLCDKHDSVDVQKVVLKGYGVLRVKVQSGKCFQCVDILA